MSTSFAEENALEFTLTLINVVNNVDNWLTTLIAFVLMLTKQNI